MTTPLDPRYLDRLRAVYAWREVCIRARTQGIATAGEGWERAIDEWSIDFVNSVVAIVQTCLGRVYSNAAALVLWDELWLSVQSQVDAEVRRLRGQDYSTGAIAFEDSNATSYLDRYRANVDVILLAAGQQPGG